jgi:hypothetical protein
VRRVAVAQRSIPLTIQNTENPLYISSTMHYDASHDYIWTAFA